MNATDNLAALFATEPPDGTVLVAWTDGVPFILERDDKEARECGAGDGRCWWSPEILVPMTLADALDGATQVHAVVPLERSGLALADSAERRAALIAEALRADGYDPPPFVGQDWEDPAVTWLPDGHRSVVRITSIGKTINGWQCRVVRRQVDAAGDTVPSGDGEGLIYLVHLLRAYRAVTP